MRQALIAQHRLHSSIFNSSGSSRWHTEQLGSHYKSMMPNGNYDVLAMPIGLPCGQQLDCYINFSSYKVQGLLRQAQAAPISVLYVHRQPVP